jgi:Reverse transcriptase (RNA-dependent DNA polymerase)
LCGMEIAVYLNCLFNRILKDGQIPKEWKEARVIPIFKGGERWRLTNYRPISLTSSICKIFETLINQYIWYILTEKGVIVESQHGFRAGYSCETQLTGLVQDISDTLDAGDDIDAIFLDMRKAFDKVDHAILIQKLASVIEDEAVTKTIENFLAGRSQRVKIGAVISDETCVTSGVPQGSVLGPLLFTIYVNDLTHNLNCRARLFADDCVVYAKTNSGGNHGPLQQDVERIQSWMTNNKMNLNLEKCEVVTFSTKRQINIKSYNIDGQLLQQKTGYKYLGVWLDRRMDWEEHISRITSKCIRNINFVMRNLKGSSKDTKNHAYKTLLRPLLEYGSAVWDPHKVKDVTALEKVQGIAARRVTGRTRKWVTKRNANGKIQKTWENPRDMVSELGWEALETRRKVSRLCNMFRARAGVPGWSELNSHLTLRVYQGRTGTGGLLHEPYANKNCGKFSYVSRTTRDWNQLGCGLLPTDISVHTFRQLITEKIIQAEITA